MNDLKQSATMLDWIEANYAQLQKEYPNQWVAVLGIGSVIAHKSLATVRDAIPQEENCYFVKYINAPDKEQGDLYLKEFEAFCNEINKRSNVRR